MTAVLIIALCFGDAGNGTWLAYAFGTVMLLFVVGCLNQFAKRSALAGSMYGYTGRGLGPTAGVISGWSLIWAYLFIGVAGLAGFAIFAAAVPVGHRGAHDRSPRDLLHAERRRSAGSSPTRTSTCRLCSRSCSSVVSVACILALAFVVLFKHGITVDTTIVKAKGMTFHGLSLAVVICIFSLVGFESATTLGGEAEESAQERPAGRDRQPAHHRGVHGVHELRRGLRHPALRHAAQRHRPAVDGAVQDLRRDASSRSRWRSEPW